MWELAGVPWERLGGAAPQVPPRASESEPVVRTSAGGGVHRGVRGAGYRHRPLIPVHLLGKMRVREGSCSAPSSGLLGSAVSPRMPGTSQASAGAA